MKKNDRSDWNNLDFVYYLLDAKTLRCILYGDVKVFEQVKKHVGSKRHKFLLLDRLINQLSRSEKEPPPTKISNIRSIIQKDGRKVEPVENYMIQSEIDWVEEEHRSRESANNGSDLLFKPNLLVLKLVLNYHNIIAVASNTYLYDKIVENGKGEQVLNWQSD